MKRKFKILIIEDEVYWQEIIREILEKENLIVKTCKTAKEAKMLLQMELFHFATIDLRLFYDSEKSILKSDEWGGWEILRLVKELSLNSTMGTMIISNYDTDEFRNKAIYKLGAVYFMSKRKFNKEEFLETLRNYLEEYSRTYFYEGIINEEKLLENFSQDESGHFENIFNNLESIRDFLTIKESRGEKTLIIFADLCDSTKYKNERGFINGLYKIFQHNRISQKIFTNFGAKFVKTIGDATMFRYDINNDIASKATTDMINASIYFMEILREKSFATNNELDKYNSKIGISIGVTANLYNEDPHGLCVDIAARINSHATAGQVLITKDLIDIANTSNLHAEILKMKNLQLSAQDLVSPLTPVTFKGIKDPIQICEIKWDGNSRFS